MRRPIPVPVATPGIEEPTLSRIKFDPEAIRALATILSDTGLTEIEIVEADSRIRVARAAAPVVAPVTYAAPPPAVAAPAAAPAAPAPSAAGTVASPMVGIAYLSAEPGAPAYVTVGQTVTAGQTVMLIEAMKTFNQIKAPRAGTVASILVTSGQPVEYDQPLMVIE
jgi:acetyl-CoA carboxylase biotin carboxyl carrier protein